MIMLISNDFIDTCYASGKFNVSMHRRTILNK